MLGLKLSLGNVALYQGVPWLSFGGRALRWNRQVLRYTAKPLVVRV